MFYIKQTGRIYIVYLLNILILIELINSMRILILIFSSIFNISVAACTCNILILVLFIHYTL